MSMEFRTVDPKGYYQYFLDKKLRPDGRELGTVREICVNVGNISTADGSSLVKVGNTTVVCGVKGELVAPSPHNPDAGFIVPNVDLSPLCSAKFKPGPPSEQAQVLTKLLDDVIRNSGCVAARDLCVYAGKLVWCLYVDLVCLNYDGNATDGVVLATLAALKTCSLPRIRPKTEGEGYEVESERSQLKVKGHVVATTFVTFNGDLMVDPTEEEERLSEGVVTLVVAEDGKVCGTHKPGGASVSDEQMKACVEQSRKQMKNVSKLLLSCSKEN